MSCHRSLAFLISFKSFKSINRTESNGGLFVPSLISSHSLIEYVKMCFIDWLVISLGQIVFSYCQGDIEIVYAESSCKHFFRNTITVDIIICPHNEQFANLLSDTTVTV